MFYSNKSELGLKINKKVLFCTVEVWQRKWSEAVGGYLGKYQLHHWFKPQSVGGTSAGWNLVSVSSWLNQTMSDGGVHFNLFRASMIFGYAGAAGTIPNAIIHSNACECEK